MWVFASIVDAVKMGFLDRSAFATRSLSPQTGNKKGVLDIFIMKKQVRDYILNTWLQTMSCPAQGVWQPTHESGSSWLPPSQHWRTPLPSTMVCHCQSALAAAAPTAVLRMDV